MSRFDKEILIKLHGKENKRTLDYSSSRINSFFMKVASDDWLARGDAQAAIGAYKKMDLFSELTIEGNENCDKLGLEYKNRLTNYLLLAELEAANAENPNTSIFDLMDMSKADSVDRKVAARERLLSVLRSKNPDDLKNFLITNTKLFRRKFEEYNKIIDSRNDHTTLHSVLVMSELAKIHTEGSQAITNVGVDAKDVDSENVLPMIYKIIDERDTEAHKLFERALRNHEIDDDRSVAAHYLFNNAITKYLLDKVSTDGYKEFTSGEQVKETVDKVNKQAAKIALATSGVISKLSPDELYKLAFTPGLKNRVKVDFSSNPEDKRVRVILDNVTLYDSDPTEAAKIEDKEAEAVKAVKKVINDEYKVYYDKQILSPIGADFFRDDVLENDIMKEASSFGVTYAQDLKKNTAFGRSSDEYRDMQKQMKKFNDFFKGLPYTSHFQDKYFPEMLDQVTEVMDSIRKYLDHKKAFEPGHTHKNEYEKTRVEAAMKAYKHYEDIQTKLTCLTKTLDRPTLVGELHQNNCKLIDGKYEASEKQYKDDPIIMNMITSAKAADYQISAIGFANNELLDDEKDALIAAFEKTCVMAIKLGMAATNGEVEVKASLARMRDEEFVQDIRNTETYKKYFSDYDNIDGDLARKLSVTDIRDEISKEFKEVYTARRTAEAAAKKVQVEEAGGNQVNEEAEKHKTDEKQIKTEAEKNKTDAELHKTEEPVGLGI